MMDNNALTKNENIEYFKDFYKRTAKMIYRAEMQKNLCFNIIE